MTVISDPYDTKNWPKRRRAIVELLDQGARFEGHTKKNIQRLAMNLEKKCRENYHPMCAMIIRMRLIGVKLDMEELTRGRFG